MNSVRPSINLKVGHVDEGAFINVSGIIHRYSIPSMRGSHSDISGM